MSTNKKGISSAENSREEDLILKRIRKGYNLPDAYFNVAVKKAALVKDIATVLNLEQLTGERLTNFYVETDKVRESDTISSLELLLKDPLKPYKKRIFSGFTGSGKTSELIKLCFNLQKEFNIIIFSALNRLRLNEITFEALLFEIVEDVLDYLYSNSLADEEDVLLKDIIDNITDWCFDTRIIIETSTDKLTSIGAGIDFLIGIFFNAKTGKRSSESDKISSTRIEERKINDLIFECNKIFDYLKKKTGKETLIIIDDLEKMFFPAAREFYIKNSAFIQNFNCKMVLTIPVELIFHWDYAFIGNVFGDTEVLPMIKIKDRNGKVFKPGLASLTEILARRLDLSLFENDCYKEAIRYSGGSVRDLFSIIQRASFIEKSKMVTEESMSKAVNFQKDIFASRIQERNDEIKIKFREYLDVLFDIHGGNKIAPEKNLALLDLLRMRAVMKYNGEGFYDTHPLLENFIDAYRKNGQAAESSSIEDVDNGYLKAIEILNFFCIENIKLDHLQDKKEIYIVGENGDGKTIFLQGILLALKGDRNVGEIINFIKQNPRNNYDLKAVDDTDLSFEFSENEPTREAIAKNVFAYGVHRSRNDSDKADEYGYLTLFEEEQYLKNPVKWLQYLHHKEKAKEKPPIGLKTAITMLKSLLNQNVDVEVTPDTVTFIERKTRVQFSQLADGYKSVIIWVCDLLEKLSRNQPGAKRIEDFRGIVLLDEIELFLHPKWKYKIVRNLRQWFPEIQFIFTTHSSTIILGASKDAVFYKLFKENGVTNIFQPVSKISNLMLNAVVTSPLFDLESAQAFSFGQDGQEHKGKLDTSGDFLYYKIHREIEARIKEMNNLTEDKILDMVKEELDKFEDRPKHA